MSRYTPDSGIPTLTQRAGPALSAPRSPATELPVLTHLAEHAAPPAQVSPAAGGTGHPHAWSTASTAGASDVVLRAALQAELEQALQHALDEAMAGLHARLDAELPQIIDRVMRNVRPG